LTTNLVKEMQLKHAAPILGMLVLDAKLKGSRSVPDPVNNRSRSTVEPKEEPNEEEKEEAPTAEQPKEEEEGGEGVKAEEETTMEKPEVAEEMKEETPVKSVAAAPKSPEESHELLICTEEQVKLLMIPSLKPKSKYRFWGDNAGDVKPPKKVVSISAKAEKHDEVEEELAKKTETDEAAKMEEGDKHGEEEEEKPKSDEVKAEEEVKPEESVEEVAPCSEVEACVTRKECLQRVASFGLQQYANTASQESVLHLVIALRSGCIVVLDLPALRRVLKGYCCDQGKCRQYHSQPPLKAHVSSTSNLVFWPVSSGQVVANEMACCPASLRLAVSPASGLKGPGYALELPEWARPKPIVIAAHAAEPGIAEAAGNPVDEEAGDAKETEEEAPASATDMKHALMSDSENNTAQQVGDITLDSIKDYLNDGSGGNVTVKTTESSLEKHTVIEGGNVVTTVHQTERIDGEVTKDDVVQVKSSSDEAHQDAAVAEKLAMLSDTA